MLAWHLKLLQKNFLDVTEMSGIFPLAGTAVGKGSCIYLLGTADDILGRIIMYSSLKHETKLPSRD
jgi:hypothetical protein